MRTLYVAWQDPRTRQWYTVGRLSFDGKVYRFVYTKGAKKSAHFLPFGRMLDLDTSYTSEELFPLFANRLLAKTRPEYKAFLHWLHPQNHTERSPAPGDLDPSGGVRRMRVVHKHRRGLDPDESSALGGRGSGIRRKPYAASLHALSPWPPGRIDSLRRKPPAPAATQAT